MRPNRRPTRLLATDLACVRGGRTVLAGLSFAVGAGEALVVSGPNGAGKSSLLRSVAGLVRLVAGRLELERQPFNLVENIFLGTRSDLNGDRHFVGRMASLIVSSYAFSIPEVHCLFTSSEEYLPAQETGCDQVPQSQVDVTFLGDTTDLSGNNRAVTANGAANVGVTGARFDGVGDDIWHNADQS